MEGSPGKSIKKPRPGNERGLPVRSRTDLAFLVRSLGCLEWIDFDFVFIRRSGHMRCQIAFSIFPLYRRLRTGGTEPTRRELSTAITPVTLFYDLMANPAIVGTPFCRHKRAFHTLSHCCTNHWNHPPLLQKNLLRTLRKKHGNVRSHA